MTVTFCDIGGDLFVPSYESPAPIWVFVGEIEVKYEPANTTREERLAMVLREIRRICKNPEDEMAIFEMVISKNGTNLILNGKLYRNDS